MSRLGSLGSQTIVRVWSRKFSAFSTVNSSKPKTLRFSPKEYKRTAEEAVSNILYNTPSPALEPKRHLINCLVRNEPGVLSRISSILAARDFNIDSIICAKTDISELSRMTIVLNENPATVKQAVRQLEDLVPVWAVLDYTGTKVLERELLMVKISLLGPDVDFEESKSVPTLQQAQTTMLALSELTKLFQGRMIDMCTDNVVIELSAKSQRINAFLTLLKPYGILEAARSGAMALSRSSDYNDHDPDSEQDTNPEVDVSALPPG